MDTRENMIREHTPGIEERLTATPDNYQQSQAEGHDQQTVLIDPAVTRETDELDPTFHQQDPPRDPEDEETDEDTEDDDLGDEDAEDEEPFPSKEEAEDDDYDLNRDADDDLSLNIDDDDEF